MFLTIDVAIIFGHGQRSRLDKCPDSPAQRTASNSPRVVATEGGELESDASCDKSTSIRMFFVCGQHEVVRGVGVSEENGKICKREYVGLGSHHFVGRMLVSPWFLERVCRWKTEAI
jgi:hypothetical protein